MGRGEELNFFICNVTYWDVLVLGELLGDERDFAYVFVVAAKVFGDFGEDLMPSFQ